LLDRTGYRSRPPRTAAPVGLRIALLFVIVVAVVAAGLWLFLAGLFLEGETNIWYIIIGGWLIGLGGDQL
jgi:high-affinity Fe2+/Pb2+ permease